MAKTKHVEANPIRRLFYKLHVRRDNKTATILLSTVATTSHKLSSVVFLGRRNFGPITQLTMNRTMEEIVQQLGLTLSLSARSAVMKDPVVARRRKPRTLACHRDSLDFHHAATKARLPKIFKQLVQDDYDDQTVSTINDDDSFSTTESGVSFATPLVTAIYERPITPFDEKKELYYTDSDYREFKRNYFFRKPDVQIHDKVVTDVWVIPVPDDPSELYYSEEDLQG